MSQIASPALATARSAAATNDPPTGNRRNSDVWLTNTRRGCDTTPSISLTKRLYLQRAPRNVQGWARGSDLASTTTARILCTAGLGALILPARRRKTAANTPSPGRQISGMAGRASSPHQVGDGMPQVPACKIRKAAKALRPSVRRRARPRAGARIAVNSRTRPDSIRRSEE
jgi:hypothetical protein